VTDAPVDQPPPRSLIITVYGLYARGSGGWLPVSSLIRLMAAVGVREPAVRSSTSRLKRRGVLIPRRVDGVAGYALSDDAVAMVADGDRRIFGRPAVPSADGRGEWLLAVFSVPETDRARRHELRSQLTRLGFGTVAPGVWIAPASIAGETADRLQRLGLDRYVQLFTGQPVDPAELARRLADWWDLPRIGRAYSAYIRRWGPVLDRWRTAPGDATDAFADYVHALTDWRRLPYLDPGLPPSLLPAGWAGGDAAALFLALRDELADSAREFAAPLLT
jgi:phenylacetic acid degradation operon negative regulatory protein